MGTDVTVAKYTILALWTALVLTWTGCGEPSAQACMKKCYPLAIVAYAPSNGYCQCTTHTRGYP